MAKRLRKCLGRIFEEDFLVVPGVEGVSCFTQVENGTELAEQAALVLEEAIRRGERARK